MKSLVLLDPYITFSRYNYPLMSNLLRVDTMNKDKMFEYIDRTPYVLSNQNILVGLLQNLAIDPEWERDFVISYIQLRSKSLFSAFSIGSNSNLGKPHPNTIYHAQCTEYYVGVSRDFESYAVGNDLPALIPLFNTISVYSYAPLAERVNRVHVDHKNDIAVIGIDLVAYGLGWWEYMNTERNGGKGIHSYAAGKPLTDYRLADNHMGVFNAVYERIVHDEPYSNLLLSEPTTFTILQMSSYIEDYLEGMIRYLKSNALESHRDLIGLLNNRFLNLYNSLMGGQYKESADNNIAWCFELSAIQLLSIYMFLVDMLGYKANGMKAKILERVEIILNRYNRIPSEPIKKLAIARLKELEKLTKRV